MEPLPPLSTPATASSLVRRGKAQFVDLEGTPHDVKAAGKFFVVANEAARQLDLVEAGDHAASIELKAEPHDLAIAPGGKTAWVPLNGTEELAIVNLRARRLVRYVKTGQRPHDILFAGEGLWEVSDEPASRRVVFLGEEPEVVAQVEDALEELPRLGAAAEQGELSASQKVQERKRPLPPEVRPPRCSSSSGGRSRHGGARAAPLRLSRLRADPRAGGSRRAES